MERNLNFASAAAVCLGFLSCAFGQADTHYATSQRIQIPEPCPVVAKWITQMLIGGTYWEAPNYTPDLGILTFRIKRSIGNFSRADTRKYTDPTERAKNVHADQVVFTLRSLVGSTLTVEGAPPSASETCTIAAAVKFVTKESTAVTTNGKFESELLQAFTSRYAAHGLDY
jgi:hypothetical protein